MTLSAQVLAAVRDGAVTSPAIARHLGTTRGTAKVVVCTMAARGVLRWTGEKRRERGVFGRLARVYEVGEVPASSPLTVL
jgi:hypothetical protein